MEIRDNIHQLSFTSFIFISFPRINSIRSSSTVSKILEECFFFFGLLRPARGSDLRYENFIKHTQSELEGASKLYLTLSVLQRRSAGTRTFFLEEEK